MNLGLQQIPREKILQQNSNSLHMNWHATELKQQTHRPLALL